MKSREPLDAQRLIGASRFVWHQRFEVAPGVYSPGTNDVGMLLDVGRIPRDVRGASVIDVGTSNGATCFELERRGAEVTGRGRRGRRPVVLRVTRGVPTVVRLRAAGAPQGRDVRSFVPLFGVLYHLRHPLIALDALREITEGHVLIETAVADMSLPANVPLVRFYRGDVLNHDPPNWFVPTTTAILDCCASSGFSVELLSAWPSGAATRAMVKATPTRGVPEFAAISYERPPRVSPY